MKMAARIFALTLGLASAGSIAFADDDDTIKQKTVIKEKPFGTEVKETTKIPVGDDAVIEKTKKRYIKDDGSVQTQTKLEVKDD